MFNVFYLLSLLTKDTEVKTSCFSDNWCEVRRYEQYAVGRFAMKKTHGGFFGGISRSVLEKSVCPGPCPTNQVTVILPWLKCQQGSQEAELWRPTAFPITAGGSGTGTEHHHYSAKHWADRSSGGLRPHWGGSIHTHILSWSSVQQCIATGHVTIKHGLISLYSLLKIGKIKVVSKSILICICTHFFVVVQ